jgi:hypothetical protein
VSLIEKGRLLREESQSIKEEIQQIIKASKIESKDKKPFRTVAVS